MMTLLKVRNTIMYSVVSAILIVASFGIYNVISTVVLEKTRDIAIMKSMGFHARDIRRIFLIEGAIVGTIGSIVGTGLGLLMMYGISFVKFKSPFYSEETYMPIYWGWEQMVIGAAFAMTSALAAAYLPARKGGRVHPVDILQRCRMTAVLRTEGSDARAARRSAGDAGGGHQSRNRAGRVRRHHGAVGLGEIVAALSARPARHADVRADLAGWRGHGRPDEDQLAEIRLARLGFVFQFHFLLAEFSALDNVLLPMRKLARLPERQATNGRATCWRPSALRITRTSARARCPAGSVSVWRWRGRSPTIR